MKPKSLFILSIFVAFQSFSQTKKTVTLEDVWQKNTFAQRTVASVNWMKSGGFYSSLDEGKIVKHNVTTGEAIETIFDPNSAKLNNRSKIVIDDYVFSSDEKKLLILTNQEYIYRHSFKAEYYVYEIATKKLYQLSTKGKQQYATFSPDGNKVAFVRNNDLFLTDLALKIEVQFTNTGKFNQIINGACDWVYEEEFAFPQAFFWSPDSKKIAFYTFDESRVPEYNMQTWGDLYPKDYKFKYPKAGEANSTIMISVYDLPSKKTTKMDIGKETNIYIPRVKWTNNSNVLSIKRLNRLQNNMDLIHADAKTGIGKVVLNEKATTYVDIEFNDELIYLADNSFIHPSEKSGFKHLYQYDANGKEIRQITAGDWEVSVLYGIDEKTKKLYFTSTEVSPLERQLYSINLDGSGKTKLTSDVGWNTANFSPDYGYYFIYNSSSKTPMQVSLFKDGQLVKVLEDNAKLKQKLSEFDIVSKDFFDFTTENGTKLNGWMMKPSNFEPTKKYPVLMFVYGGPGSQTVKNQWDTRDFFWYQVLASKGYVIASVDNRGTGARGRDFKHITYANLGKYEVIDQIESAKYLGSLPFVDKSRMGIWGWSYGGYMSSNCIMQGADVFKTAIAVAPVTNWRFYDTIYTERYQKTPQENAAGYDDNSPVSHVDKLKGNFFLIHGTGDDNVHFQNAVMLQNALIKSGKQFESFYYPNRNHGISGGNTRLHLYQMMTDYLLKKL
jgi:dipeptidyl-peptidase 4